MLPSPLNVGLGLEYRVEQFEVTAVRAGIPGLVTRSPGGLRDQDFGIGSNGFNGFSLQHIAGTNNRGSYAGYVDLETNLSKDLLVGVAGRYEEFETFGDTLNGKFNARWQATSIHGASRRGQQRVPGPDRGTGEHSERDHGVRRWETQLTS